MRSEHFFERTDVGEGRKGLVQHDDMAEEMVDALIMETAWAQLSEDDERALGTLQVVEELLRQTAVVGGWCIASDDTFLGQRLNGEVKQRLVQRHVDMHAGVGVVSSLDKCLVHQTVAMPRKRREV